MRFSWVKRVRVGRVALRADRYARGIGFVILLAALVGGCKRPAAIAPAGTVVQLTGARTLVLLPNGNYPIDASFSADGKILAVGCTDKQVRLFDFSGDSDPKELSAMSSKLLSIRHSAISPDGRLVAITFAKGQRPGSASEASCLRVFQTGQNSDAIDPVVLGADASCDQVAFSPDGNLLAFGIDDPPAHHRVEVLSMPSGQVKLKTEFPESLSPPSSIAFSADNQLLAVSCGRVAHVIETATGKDTAMLIGTDKSTDSIASVSFSMDSQTLAVLSTDGNLSLWDPVTKNEKLLDNKKVHRKFQRGAVPMPIAYSVDGRYLAIYSPDEALLLDARSLTTLATFEGSTKSITSFAFGPREKRLVTTDQTGAVKLWELK